MRELGGIIPPIVTPFTPDGEVDIEAVRAELRYHVEAGVDGVSVTGSTGEGNALSLEEHERLYRVAVEEAGEDLPVVAGNISTSAREAGAKAELAADAGADYVMATPPYYQTPTDRGLIEYYREIGRAGGLPILIYDVVEKVDVTADIAVEMLDEVPELYGIKQSGGDFHGFVNMLSAVGDRLSIFSALDDLLYPTFRLGADGAIAGVNAIYPRLSVELWEAVREGDDERAERIYWATLPLARAAVWDYDVNYPGGVKEAIDQLGREPGETRVPIRRPSESRRQLIAEAIGHMHNSDVYE